MYVDPIDIFRPAFIHACVTRTKLFQSNRSQGVRLPKEVAFPDGVREVRILRDGARRVIAPADALWDDVFDAPGVDMPAREQPEPQVPEKF